MALLYRVDLHPTKLELLAAWLPTRGWYRGPRAPDVTRVASFRFDDPDGEVGIETILVRVGDGPLLQAPLTYRGAPLDGREQWLIGTTHHGVLGQRWVYDACGDPVYAAVLANTILAGVGQAEQLVETDGRLVRREPDMSVSASGSADAEAPAVNAIVRVDDTNPTRIVTDSIELVVARALDGTHTGPSVADSGERLIGTWRGQPTPVLLAQARAL